MTENSLGKATVNVVISFAVSMFSEPRPDLQLGTLCLLFQLVNLDLLRQTQ